MASASVSPLTMAPAYGDTSVALRALAKLDEGSDPAVRRAELMAMLGPEGWL